jgi:outer membrane receptor protein involved in Fe transport
MLAMLAAASLLAAPTVDTVQAGTLRGRVTDTAGVPVHRAEIIIQEIHRSTATTIDGQYRLSGVPEGSYSVSYRAIGYRPVVVRLTIGEGELVHDVQMLPSLVELPPIQATATPLATAALESPQPLAVLQQGELRAAQAASLGQVLEGLPGVRSLGTGNGIAKPVIRGLGSNRVLVLDNGQRTESQEWGDEHAPNVETAQAERIEVVRGPASVLYGSDALGGVINVVAPELPDAEGGPPRFGGRLDLGYGGNGNAPDASARLEGAAGALGFRASLTGRRSEDVRTPGRTLGNTGYEMVGGAGALGVRDAWGSLTATYSRRTELVEIHEDPEEEPDATPRQRIASDRVGVTGNVSLGAARLETDLGWEQNARREFESFEADEVNDVALRLVATTWTGNVHLHHASGTRAAGVVGMQALRTDVATSGEETLVPASRTLNVAGYAFEQLDLGRFQVSVGARVDHRTLENDAAAELGRAAGKRDWTAVSGNAGVLYRLAEPAAVVLNVGRGFRAPSAFELFANGVHEGTVRYEIGNPDLETEHALNVDLALRLASEALQAEVGVFNNRVTGYIFPDPTAEIDPESGYQVHRYAQADADLRGIEASLQYHATTWLHLGATMDYTHGTNRSTDRPLAFVAPLRVQASARVEAEDLGPVSAPWIEAEVESHAKQTRVDPDDFAPDGYALVGVGFGGRVGRFDVAVRVRNLFDATYRQFLSRYKRYADEMGRNVRLSVSVDL